MILQMVRNECLRFGGHVDIEVRYKILQLDVLKKTQILHNRIYCIILHNRLYLALNRGCFEVVLMKNTSRTLGVKVSYVYF
jgi:hypothetical protein